MSDFKDRYAAHLARKEDQSEEIARLQESRDRWSDFKDRYAAHRARKADQSDEIARLTESRDRWKERAQDLQTQIDAWVDAPAPPSPDLTDDVATLKLEIMATRKTVKRQESALETARQRSRERQAMERQIATAERRRDEAEAKAILLTAECEGHRVSKRRLLRLLREPPENLAAAIRKTII